MLALLVLVFLAVFVVAVLLLSAGKMGSSKQSERTLATLHAALATIRPDTTDQAVDVRKQELLSSVPWLNRWLLGMDFAPRLRLLLYQANLKWTVSALLLLCFICFAIPAYLIFLRTDAIVFSLLIGVALSSVPLIYVIQKRTMRFNKFEQGLPETLDLMVSAMRAGHSFISALDLAANEAPDPIGKEFRICFDEQNYGLELKTAMANLSTRVPLQDLKIIITATLIQKESGGNLAEVFDKAAYVIRERFRLKRQIMVHTAQGRLTGWILSLLPVVLGIALYIISPDTMSLLWKRPIGVKLLYASGTMTIIGALIIRKIVRMDV
ncbi:type II secretion system F family protein [Edaphobacter sp.]|uniref:type II secretion system F family protein n=1 Tax=Edaphobacter sp. TaxID=1934404 RepID=UPI002DB7AACB|nr:type II secretion system F family protein [Edaphobacter sp.]HEU5341883.1 type II secretion system F family protein [Edaphobacter sp.]